MKLRSLFLVYGVTAPILLVLRLIQMLFLIDPETGFYYPQWEFADTAIMVLQIVVIVTLIVMSRFCSHAPGHILTHSKSLGILSFILSASLVVYIFEYGLSMHIMNTGDYIYLLLALAFAVFMVYYGFCIMGKIDLSQITAIIPVLFAAFRLALMFTKRNGIAKISDTVNETIMMGLVMLFWLLFGKITVGMDTKKSSRYAYGIGAAASAMCFVVAVPKYIIDIFMTGTKIHSTSVPSFIDIVTGIFIMVFLFKLLKNDRKQREQMKYTTEELSSVSQVGEEQSAE